MLITKYNLLVLFLEVRICTIWFDPFIKVSTAKILERFFRESLVIELYWEKKIDYLIDSSLKQENETRISVFKLVKRFFSKKIRTICK